MTERLYRALSAHRHLRGRRVLYFEDRARVWRQTTPKLLRMQMMALEKAAALTPRGAGVHILVVDDEIDARELVAEVLSSCKAKVSTAGSVAAALEYVRQHHPEVVVSDIGMPGDDG